VAAGALALSRVPQVERPGYADKVAERYAGPLNGTRKRAAVAPPPPPPTRSSKRPPAKTKAVGKTKAPKAKAAPKTKARKPSPK